MENITIGVFATMSFLHFKDQTDFSGSMIKTLIIYIAIAVISYFAVMNIVLCILLNGLVFFWIGYSFMDEYQPDGYYPPGLALIFFQNFRAEGLDGLLNRFAAILASFIILFLFLIIIGAFKKEDPLKKFTREGISLCKEIISIIEAGDNVGLEIKQKNLFKINRKISSEIYMANRNSIRSKVSANQYCIYVAFFQIVYLFINEQISDTKTHEESEDTPFYNDLEMIKNMTANFEAALQADIALTDNRRLYLRIKKLDIRSFRLRFALRTGIVLTVCLAFAYVTSWANIYWLPIAVFFTMLPIYDNVEKRVAARVKGTIAGILACAVLFPVFNDFASRVIILTIANFFIYTLKNDTLLMMNITCACLAMDLASMPVIMLARVFGYNIFGAAITYTGNRFVFPIRITKEVEYIMKLLDDIRETIPGFKGMERNGQKYQTNRLILLSYLLGSRLEVYSNTLKLRQTGTDFSEYMKRHMITITRYL
ncbi:FUSC family protein [Parasporobacterium paucivorans]|nr:FUSC family protein [Parasporobacterium paucivorans]